MAGRFAAGTPPEAMDFLLRILADQGGMTLQAAESAGMLIPLHPADAAAAERDLVNAERAALAREETILALRDEIDALLAPLFEAVPHPRVETANLATVTQHLDCT